MDDHALVTALVSGDPRGLDGAYRAYADRLYTYCRFLLRDADTAADVIHDTFAVASQRAAQLRDPRRLRPWLYAIARNECLRVPRARLLPLPVEEAGQIATTIGDPATGPGAGQVRELVWAAAAGLKPVDRQVFELAVRHDLPAADVGAVLGISADHAHARLARARTHCEARWGEQVSPAALFSAYASLPLLVVPADLWPRLRLTCAHPADLLPRLPLAAADPGSEARRRTLDRRAGRFDPDTGFPQPLDARRRRHRRQLAIAAAVALLLSGGAALAPRLAAGGDPAARSGPDQPPAITQADASGAVDPTAPLVPSPSNAAANPEPSPTGAAARRTPPPPGEPPAEASPDQPDQPGDPASRAPLTLAAVGRVACNGGFRYALTVRATVTGGTAASAVLYWTTATTERAAMRVTGGGLAGQRIPRLQAPRVTWWVTVTAADGRRTGTEPTTDRHPCPEPVDPRAG